MEQGLPYYDRFVTHYPTVHDMAAATEQAVLKTWEGLGYYSRARNLHATAKYVSENLDGTFPKNYSDLLSLKGVGPYTAAAIASICYNEPVPVIDGNVFRFASRYFGIREDIGDAKTRKIFEKVLSDLIPTDHPGMFNQGMMEYGATVCKPGKPLCGDCIFRDSCYAYQHEQQLALPIKKSKVKVQERYINYLIFDTGAETLMRQRKEGFWTGLYEFYNVEKLHPIPVEEIAKVIEPFQAKIVEVSNPIKHLLSHRKLWVTFYHIRVQSNTLEDLADHFQLSKFSWEDVLTLPRPKVIVNHLHEADF